MQYFIVKTRGGVDEIRTDPENLLNDSPDFPTAQFLMKSTWSWYSAINSEIFWFLGIRND